MIQDYFYKTSISWSLTDTYDVFVYMVKTMFERFKFFSGGRGVFIRIALTICSSFGALKYFKYVFFGFIGFYHVPDCNGHLSHKSQRMIP